MEGEKSEEVPAQEEGAEQVQESHMEGEGEAEGEGAYDMDDSAADDDIFKNNHDLIGI